MQNQHKLYETEAEMLNTESLEGSLDRLHVEVKFYSHGQQPYPPILPLTSTQPEYIGLIPILSTAYREFLSFVSGNLAKITLGSCVKFSLSPIIAI